MLWGRVLWEKMEFYILGNRSVEPCRLGILGTWPAVEDTAVTTLPVKHSWVVKPVFISNLSYYLR